MSVLHCGVQWLSGRASDFQSRGPGFKTTCVRVPDFSVDGMWVQNHLRCFEAWATLFTPLCLCLGRDSKSRWSLLSGAYARGSKRPHTGKWKMPTH